MYGNVFEILNLKFQMRDYSSANTQESDPTETLISPAKRQKIPDNSGPSSSSSINTVLKSPNLVSNPSKPSSTPTPHKPDKSATGWTANTNKSLAKRSTKTKAKPRKKKEPYVPSVAAQEAAQTVQAASFEELTNKTYAELKGICTDLGLPRGGYKVEIVRRLKNDHLIDTILTTGLGKKHTKEGTKKLVKERLGVSPSKCSKCFLQAVSKGFINLEVESPLDAVVAKTISLCCSKDITVRVRDIMYQKDSPGMDYADGGQNASVFCPECEAGVYITGMCEGQFSPDCGRFHRHKQNGKGFGTCSGGSDNRRGKGCVIQ